MLKNYKEIEPTDVITHVGMGREVVAVVLPENELFRTGVHNLERETVGDILSMVKAEDIVFYEVIKQEEER